MTAEKIYIWAAKGLKPTSQHLDDGEFLDVAACRLTMYCRW